MPGGRDSDDRDEPGSRSGGALRVYSRREWLKQGTAAAATAVLPLAALATAGCIKRPAGAPGAPLGPSGTEEVEDSLRTRAAVAGLVYGCAVEPERLTSDAPYAALVRQQAAMLVAENAMKWHALRPAPDRFRFEGADTLVAFADANRMKVRGHNLCWHRALPDWFEATATPANAARLLTDHIEQVAGRYAGRMHSWDVVNEAVWLPDGRSDGLRNSPWLKLAGSEYLEIAFRAARSADPAALLTYNEYGIEDETYESEQKRAAVLLLLRRMQARNVPVDAVGVQSHILARPMYGYGRGLMRFLRSVREMGLQVFLSELEVNDRLLGPDDRLRDGAVATAYRQYLDLVLADPAVTAVVNWGITDRYTWLNSENGRPDHRPERCLPFDPDLKPALGFFAMRDAFDHRAGNRAVVRPGT